MARRRQGDRSEAEREERRKGDREQFEAAVCELLSSEGWQRWVRTRRLFHRYSLLRRPRRRFANRSESGSGLCAGANSAGELALELRSKLLRELHRGFDFDTSD
jgi:hypothetical protein